MSAHLPSLPALNRSSIDFKPYPVRIVQFGEGNFLRAFVDWLVDNLNEKANYDTGVAVVQPIGQGIAHLLSVQDGLYHHVIQGIEYGELVDEVRLNTCIQSVINPYKDQEAYFQLATSKDVKLVFSNTTEAGIAFEATDKPDDALAATFPGKLTQFLKRRYDVLGASEESALGIVPCELVENNGVLLKECVLKYADLWQLGDDFSDWVETHLHFVNTLVDRIVPGYPAEEIDAIKTRIGYDDKLVVKSESFHLFVIEKNAFVMKHFPAHEHGFNVKYVDSITPYRTQKVRILNGAHTSMVPVGLLHGVSTVREAMENEQVGNFMHQVIFDEIIPTVQLPGEDPKVFAEQVLARFRNPFIRHQLITISLNSVSKWKVRVLPTVLDYLEIKGELPKRLTASLAYLIQLYLSDKFTMKDDENVLYFFEQLKHETNHDELVRRVLSNHDFWGQDLTQVPGMLSAVAHNFQEISANEEASLLTALLH